MHTKILFGHASRHVCEPRLHHIIFFKFFPWLYILLLLYHALGSIISHFYSFCDNLKPLFFVFLKSVADVERAIIKALEKQYNDILTPLKDTIPKRLNMHVQKLTRRQSTTQYFVPNQVSALFLCIIGISASQIQISNNELAVWQLGIFLNTIKRILDVLHVRVEEVLKSWASYLPVTGERKLLFGEQMNGITVLLRTKYKNYLQASVEKLVSNVSSTLH